MTEPARSLPAPSPEPTEALPAGRSTRQLGVWFDLLDRLAERREKYEGGQVAQPPTRAQVLLDKAVWKVIVFARWLRPHLSRTGLLSPRPLLDRLRQGMQFLARSLDHVHGRLLWQRRRRRSSRNANQLKPSWLARQWYLLRTDPDRRLAAYGLVGGFGIPLTLIVVLSHFTLQPIEPLLQPYIDPSVPVPSAALIAEEEQDNNAAPVEVPDDTIVAEPVPVATPGTIAPEALSDHNFRFEYFARRDDQGRLHLLSVSAEKAILSFFPIGTPAVNVMRFFGDVMMRSGSSAGESAAAAQARCMALPVNKMFTVKTVTCTYGHTTPLPRAARENERNRVFWIMALSYDNSGRLLDLRLHARTVLATQ